MKQFLLSFFGKTLSLSSKIAGRGHGSTMPGHLALMLNNNYIKELTRMSPTKIILIVGTNGKTTTGKILTTILQANGKKVFQNSSGANLLNGIASSLLLNTGVNGTLKKDFAIFEVDENNLPLMLKQLTPSAIIALDLFRDQLDRYGELDSIAKKWQESFMHLPKTTQLILNADDPLIAYLADKTEATVSFFGMSGESDKTLSHAADSVYCPRCSHKLHFSTVFYSHLGIWKCPKCHFTRPIPQLSKALYPLPGTYNKYNTLAAALAAQQIGFTTEQIEKGLAKVTPAFGRQEKIRIKNKTVQLFLSKNPTSFNESFATVKELGGKHIALLLNDRIPDGRDVSWIWDIDVEDCVKDFENIYIGGDRVYDMALRIHYAYKKQLSPSPLVVEEDLKSLLEKALVSTPADQTLFILPTYSAMLETRKILTGRSIL